MVARHFALRRGPQQVVSMLLAKEGVDGTRPRIMVSRRFILRVIRVTVRWCRCWPEASMEPGYEYWFHATSCEWKGLL